MVQDRFKHQSEEGWVYILASEAASYCHASESSTNHLKLVLHYAASKKHLSLSLSVTVCELVQPNQHLSNLAVAVHC